MFLNNINQPKGFSCLYKRYAKCNTVTNSILRTLFLLLLVLLLLSPYVTAQTAELPATIAFSFEARGSGVKEYEDSGGLSQQISYCLDVKFDVEGINPRQEGGFVIYDLSNKQGELYFNGTAIQKLPLNTQAHGFGENRIIDLQVTDGTLRYPTTCSGIENCNDITVAFPIPDSSGDTDSRYIQYSGPEGIVRDTVIFPYPWNQGYIDHNYDVPLGSDADCCAISLQVEKEPLSAGDTTLVTATTVIGALSAPLQWDLFIPEDSKAKAVITPDGGLNKTARITEVSGEGSIKIIVTNSSFPDCKKERWIQIGCKPCEREECKDGNCIKGLPGEGIRWNTGRTSRGRQAGEIFLPNDEVNCANALLELLEVRSFGNGVEVLSDVNGLRQVVSPDSFVDISVIDDYGYTLSFYKSDDRGDLINGYYEVVAGATPFVTWKVENPDGSQGSCDRLRIVEERGGSAISSSEYAFNGVDNTWSFSDGNGLQVNIQQEEVVDSNRVVTDTVKDGSDAISSKTKTTYKNIVCSSGSTEEIIETVDDPDGFALTTTTAWYDDSSATGSCGKTASQVYPDGSWVKYEYDDQGRKTVEIRSWLDAPLNTAAASAHATYYDYAAQHADDSQAAEDTRLPRKVTGEILGNVVSKAYYVYVINSDGS
ncbi:MAG: hypothetical protein GY928_06530, partial [Colwellia sp.]|nr:hypothetical protein [Colwellia sp.]